VSTPRPTQFGRIHPPDEAWLAKRPPEPILEPDLPVIDTHHHLWERPDHRYLLHEFLDDVRAGHNVVATVFMECHSMYRASGPEEMRPVGETEFVAGVAAMSESGQYGSMRVAAGIVGFELFGPNRCMFESNFPMDKMGIGWAALWNALKRIAAGASPHEKRAMFSGTARRVYRLN
jgi:predicted TIM-barrel fold metal-dependent hydrolase